LIVFTLKQPILFDSISKIVNWFREGKTEWIGTVNFNLRKPNFIIIHHTAQDSIQQTISTLARTRTQVSAHYIIALTMVCSTNATNYLGHGTQEGSWGKNDINSASIGIELTIMVNHFLKHKLRASWHFWVNFRNSMVFLLKYNRSPDIASYP
jgi:N-acetylmuramoyl-L-alanine amidase